MSASSIHTLTDRITGRPVEIWIEPECAPPGRVYFDLRIGPFYAVRCVDAGRAVRALCQIEAALGYATGKENQC